MSNLDNFLWQALTGAMGPEKVAYLRSAPLTTVLDLPHDFSVADAAGEVSKTAFVMHEEQKAIGAAVDAMKALGLSSGGEKTASLSDRIHLAHKLRIMEEGAPGVKTAQDAGPLRAALHEDIVDTIKAAGVGGILDGISKNPTLRQAGKNMLTAGGTAAGIAVPTVAAGSYLSDEFTDDARDKALQTAAGVGGLAMLGYGGKKLMDVAANEEMYEDKYDAMGDYKERTRKTGSVSLGQFLPQEKVAHLVTACFLDELLSSVEQTEKVAGIRRLNREFIVDELLTKEANVGAAIGGGLGGALGPYGAGIGGGIGGYLGADEHPGFAAAGGLNGGVAGSLGGAILGGLGGAGLGYGVSHLLDGDVDDWTHGGALGGALLGSMLGGGAGAGWWADEAVADRTAELQRRAALERLALQEKGAALAGFDKTAKNRAQQLFEAGGLSEGAESLLRGQGLVHRAGEDVARARRLNRWDPYSSPTDVFGMRVDAPVYPPGAPYGPRFGATHANDDLASARLYELASAKDLASAALRNKKNDWYSMVGPNAALPG